MHTTTNIIMGGDFNGVLDTDIDRLNSVYNNANAMQVVKENIEELQLVDIWRVRNPKDRRYTWFRCKGTNQKCSASRIDYFLVTVGLAAQIYNTNISIGCRTDHSLIEFSMEDPSDVKGSGVWRFNNTLLANKDFCSKMSLCLQESQKVVK